MKKIITLSLMVCLVNILSAQTFQKDLIAPGNNGLIENIFIDAGGNYLHCGILDSSSTSGESSALLIKTDVNGALLWSKKFFDGGQVLHIRGIADAANSGYLASGHAYGLVSYPFLIRLDAAGNLLWFKKYSFSGSGNAGGGIIKSSANVYYIAGAASGGGFTSLYNICILKIDSTGSTLSQNAFGTSYSDYLIKMIPAGTGFLILGECGISGNRNNTLLIKVNSLMTVDWIRLITDSVTWKGYDVIEKTGGNFLVCGKRDNATTNDEGWMVEINGTNGNMIWSKSYSNPMGGLNGEAITTDGAGNYFFGGFAVDQYCSFMIKTDGSGTLLSSRLILNGFYINTFKNDGGNLLVGGENLVSTYPGIVKIPFSGTFACLDSSIAVTTITRTTPISAPTIYTTTPNFSTTLFTPTMNTYSLADACIPTSINEHQQIGLDREGILAYPVPASYSMHVAIVNEALFQKKKMTIYDVVGKKLYDEEFKGNEISINVSEWQNGLYVISISTEDKIMKKAIVVNH